MTNVHKTLSVNNFKQLIDLNGDSVNFDITFSVKSQNGEPFDLIVVDQQTLDSGKTLEYKTIEDGIISGHLVNDSDKYQNYFLCIKSTVSCECNINIIKKEIQPKRNIQNTSSHQLNKPELQSHSNNSNFLSEWKWYILVFVILLIVLYWYFYYKDSSSITTLPYNIKETQISSNSNMSYYNNSNKSVSPSPSVRSSSASHVSSASPVSSVSINPNSNFNFGNTNLANRFKSFKTTS